MFFYLYHETMTKQKCMLCNENFIVSHGDNMFLCGFCYGFVTNSAFYDKKNKNSMKTVAWNNTKSGVDRGNHGRKY